MKKLLIIVCMLLAVAACKKDSDSAIPVTQSNFMFFNGAPGGSFKVSLDTFEIAGKIGFGEHTPYKQFRAQLYNIYITDLNTTNPAVRVGQINLRNKRSFSAYIGLDSVRKQYFLRTIEDDLTAPGGTNMKVRVVNLGQTFRDNTSEVAIDLYGATADTVAIARGLGQGAVTPFVMMDGNGITYQLNFRRNDLTTPKDILSIYPLAGKPGKIYTLVTTGNLRSSESFKVFMLEHN